MKFYDMPTKFGKDKTKGPGVGFGPKGSKIMVVRGLDKSPSPLKYALPKGISQISKSFGDSRGNCKGVIRGDKTADKVVPGPGTYI